MKDIRMLWRQKNRQGAGFTLVELLVTISIIGILLAIVVLSATQIRERSHIKAETSEISYLLGLMRTYAEATGHYPGGSTTLAYNSDNDNDSCSLCYLRSGDTTSAATEWAAGMDSLVAKGLITQQKARYEDEWGNPYAYDNNSAGVVGSTHQYWSMLCSMGPDGTLQTYTTDNADNYLRTVANPVAEGDDICTFFR